MFRPMRRIKQQLAEDEALEVLKSAKRGVLSVIGDDGWPYGICRTSTRRSWGHSSRSCFCGRVRRGYTSRRLP